MTKSSYIHSRAKGYFCYVIKLICTLQLDIVLKLKADKSLSVLLIIYIFFHAENIKIIDKFNLQKMFNYEHDLNCVRCVLSLMCFYREWCRTVVLNNLQQH